MRIASIIILMTFAGGCTIVDPGPPFPRREQILDSYISFSYRDRAVAVQDWVGGEAMPPTMGAHYIPWDSTLWIVEDGDTAQLSIVLHVRPLPGYTGSLPNTGTIPLTLPTIPLHYYVDSIGTNTSSFVGNATLYLPDGTWSTDSLHTGTINITSVDTINKKITAVFSFVAIDTLRGSSFQDTIRVSNGLVHKLPLDVF